MLVKRLISSAIIIITTLAFLIFSFNPFVLCIGTMLICGAAVFEALQSTKYFDGRSFTVCGILLSVAMPIAAYFGIEYMFFAYFAFMMTVFVLQIIFFKTFDFKRTCVVVTISSLVSLLLSTMILVRTADHGLFLLFYIFGCAWMTDSGAYIFGSLFGKHKLCPLISPKKSVEGAIGGIVFNLIGVVVLIFIFKAIFNEAYRFELLLPVALVASVFAEIGDLIASIIKRTFNIKDFGNVIPGHGGIFDRFDSVMLVAPFVFSIFSFVSPV